MMYVTYLVVEDPAGVLYNVRDLGNGLPASFKLSRHTVAATDVCADLGGREGGRRGREGGEGGREEGRREKGRRGGGRGKRTRRE